MRFYFLLIASCLLFATGVSAQSYDEHVQLSYDCMEQDDLDGAAEHLKAAMRMEPANRANFALLMNLGTIQRRQGALDEALISYSAALGQQPDNQYILENRASLFAEMGDIEMAINDYQAILSTHAEDQETLYQQGILYLQLNNLILAESNFERMMELDTESAKARLGYAILEKVRGNYDESEVILNYLIEKFPAYLRLYEERAELYYLMSKNRRAMADLEKISSENPEPSAEFFLLRGKVKLSQYEKESAALDFKKALSLGYDKDTIEKWLKMTY